MAKALKPKSIRTDEGMVAFQLSMIATILIDISKSLAILADKVESRDKE